MAVAEFASNWDQDGLDAIKKSCDLSGINLTVDRMVGTNGPGICKSRHGGYSCAEAMLDITYIKALAGNIELTDVFSRAEFSIQSWAMQLAQMSDADLPLVHSVSFGENEEELPSLAYMEACNVEFQKLGLRGVSILVASGDGGVWGRGGSSGAFHPDFPAASPFVTAVGGTILTQTGQLGDERVWNNGGVGFSNAFVRPTYQQQQWHHTCRVLWLCQIKTCGMQRAALTPMSVPSPAVTMPTVSVWTVEVSTVSQGRRLPHRFGPLLLRGSTACV